MPFEFGFMVQSMILGRESKEIHQKSKMECDVQHCFRQMRFLIFQLSRTLLNKLNAAINMCEYSHGGQTRMGM